MFCNQCGAQVPDNAKFCQQCRSPIQYAPDKAPETGQQDERRSQAIETLKKLKAQIDEKRAQLAAMNKDAHKLHHQLKSMYARYYDIRDKEGLADAAPLLDALPSFGQPKQSGNTSQQEPAAQETSEQNPAWYEDKPVESPAIRKGFIGKFRILLIAGIVLVGLAIIVLALMNSSLF